MSDADSTSISTKHYFVDEAGDATLFDARGRVIAGTAGCSSHFMLGVLSVADPIGLNDRFGSLHKQVLADPFYEGVPSLRPEQRKTAVLFHAKDDIPEIRERVFRLLAAEDIRFFGVVRDKRGVAVDVRNRNRQSVAYRYHPNRLYDEMVRRLFKNLLHRDGCYQVCFSRRGSKDRTGALKTALEQARENFRRQWNITTAAPIEVSALPSKDSYCLQATDYLLWALQRLYTKAEDRYLKFLWSKVGVIQDVDDRRSNRYGVYYSSENPLTAEKIQKQPGI
ncbi:DUF3800 domain-containing protein [Fontivita pretiosa]|uniref:DUF3800 domain-containing protein n=1 Tax=Fontivita pretiosa TaxID=2989684 RepID=UPI003D17225A